MTVSVLISKAKQEQKEEDRNVNRLEEPEIHECERHRLQIPRLVMMCADMKEQRYMAPEVTTPSIYSTQVEPRSSHRDATVCSTMSLDHKNEKEYNLLMIQVSIYA